MEMMSRIARIRIQFFGDNLFKIDGEIYEIKKIYFN